MRVQASRLGLRWRFKKGSFPCVSWRAFSVWASAGHAPHQLLVLEGGHPSTDAAPVCISVEAVSQAGRSPFCGSEATPSELAPVQLHLDLYRAQVLPS